MRKSWMLAALAAIFTGSVLAVAWPHSWMRSDWADRLLIEPLESRYPRAVIGAPDSFTGIIALSGDDKRFTEAGRLARRFPTLKVLLSSETDLDKALAKLGGGIHPSRVILEMKAKSTYENASFCASLVKPKPQDRWLLVTGALHMPRAVASFRRAGFEVEPWPVYDALSQASMISPAIHEWLGLVAYRLLGRTGQLLPM